jgi:ApaG protein
MERFWHIVNGQGQVQEVRGPGVVGEQPELRPGESFQYQSACPLPTPQGSMEGHYGEAAAACAQTSGTGAS